MSHLKFKSIHKFSRATITTIKHTKKHVYNNSQKITLPLGPLGYCKTNATVYPTEGRAFRVNNILKLPGICQSTIFNEDLSINNIKI